MIKKFDCIICPMSCHIDVEMDAKKEILKVQGNRCPRGEAYVRQEVICPMRMLTSTVRIHHAIHPLLPVITSQNVPRDTLFDIMEIVNTLEVQAPIHEHQVLVHNIANSGADLLASRSMDRR